MRRVRKFLSLSFREKILLIKAALVVLASRLGLTLIPFSTLQNHLTKGPDRQTNANPEHRPSIEQVAWSVAAASNYVPKATCLTQALALQIMLQQEGYPASLQIGVMKDEKGQFQAHAWVESQGRILNGGSEIEQYKPMPLEQDRG